mmetsp:Transcript_30391/g.76420  ORF Transcript_30391/g.76420 Transcript_30391/m.76420 type:complete len:236 (-) Transcript_30391:286-993(-)
MRGELEDLKRKLAMAEKSKENAEEASRRLKEEVDKQSHKTARAEQSEKEISKGVEDVKSQQREAVKQKSEAEAKAADLEVKIQKLQADLQRDKSQSDAQIAQMYEELRAQKTYISQLQTTLDGSQKDAHNQRIEAQKMRGIADGLEEEKKLLSEEVRGQRERIDKYESLHAMDSRDSRKKDDMLAQKDRELERLRTSFKSSKAPDAPSSNSLPPDVHKPGVSESNSISNLLKSFH